MIRLFRSPRARALTILVASLLAVAPRWGRAAEEVAASRLDPSSLSARYGSAIPLKPGGAGGGYLVPTRTGIEIRGVSAGDPLFGTFRTAGAVNEAAWSGRTAYLFAGDRGIVAVDASDTTNLAAIGGHDHLGTLRHGAFAPAGATLAAATDSTLYFLRETAPGRLSLVRTHTFRDGRMIIRVRARADSFLVLSTRSVPGPRMFLTLYRSRSGALPESLWEVPANGMAPVDLAWPDAMAFLAVGAIGIVPFDTVTRLFGSATAVISGKLIRSVDADPGFVVAVGEARTYAQFIRAGVKGETLTGESDRLTAIEPVHVSIVGTMAVISEDDQTFSIEPDETGRSLIEIRDIGQPAQPPRTVTTGDGRVRRVVWDQGLAYLADYTGGLRIYRAGSADSSLVGVLPTPPNGRIYDLALDPARHLAYVASGSAGLFVVDVSDPAAPAPISTLGLPGSVTAVAVAGPGMVVVAHRGFNASGVTFVDVADSFVPFARGSVNSPSVQEPRSIAVKDTIAFVADELLGLVSIRFGNPGAPAPLGFASGVAARDLDLSGNLLLVGTRAGGVELRDVFNPASPGLLSTLPTPPLFGVAQQGQTALALLGEQGALAIDIRDARAPLARGVIAVPGFSRDAAWVGDTLLIAESFGLERYRASAVVMPDPALLVEFDRNAVIPRVRISWTVSPPPGSIGWNVVRDRGIASQGLQAEEWDTRVHDGLLNPGERSVIDGTIVAGTQYRYRLEAFFADGSSRTAAEGTLYVPSNSAVGRVYPNPYRPRAGLALKIPYRVLSVDGGKSIELRVFDAAGRLVREIRGATAPGGGFGSLTWDGRDTHARLVPDGIYFLGLEGPGIDDARQLILLH